MIASNRLVVSKKRKKQKAGVFNRMVTCSNNRLVTLTPRPVISGHDNDEMQGDDPLLIVRVLVILISNRLETFSEEDSRIFF